jgi:hypothetical protein
MINELANDPRIHDRYQFWLFSYNTGNPILYSAMLLRDALSSAVERLDPEGKDPSLRRMVVIGHSQGGLLSKLTAVDSGSRFWDAMTSIPFSQVALSDVSREMLERAVFIHPLPFVRRLIFISTPQHGSYFAGNRLSHWAARFITFPVDVVHTANDIVLRNQKTLAFARLGHVATAVDNMTPGTRFIRTLSALPIAPGVHAHSIISVRGNGPVETGDDGVVAYASAHIEPVESEVVVRSGHSCQSNPQTIAEVRRILLLHLDPARNDAFR